MTIVEFLIARLDERESGIRQAMRTEDWGVSQFDLDDVESKRAIVAAYERSHENRNAHPDDPAAAGALLALLGATKHLASVYSYHPDYREEWKP